MSGHTLLNGSKIAKKYPFLPSNILSTPHFLLKTYNVGDHVDGKSRGSASPLCSPLCSDSGWALEAASSCDDKGMETGWLFLVPKERFSISGGSSVSTRDESFTLVF